MTARLPRRILPLALASTVGLCAAPARADETSSRWIAALPFGAGQLHRGDLGLGIFFAAGEAVLGGTSIATWARVEKLGSADIHAPLDFRALNDEMRILATVNRVAFAGWAALTVAGLIEAQVNIGRRSEPRGQPRPPVGITVGAVPGGASMGLRMAF